MTMIESRIGDVENRISHIEIDCLYMSEGIENIRGYIMSIENTFMNYAEQNPKSDDNWLEERLRALESQVSELMKIIKRDGISYVK